MTTCEGTLLYIWCHNLLRCIVENSASLAPVLCSGLHREARRPVLEPHLRGVWALHVRPSIPTLAAGFRTVVLLLRQHCSHSGPQTAGGADRARGKAGAGHGESPPAGEWPHRLDGWSGAEGAEHPWQFSHRETNPCCQRDDNDHRGCVGHWRWHWERASAPAAATASVRWLIQIFTTVC